MFSNQKNSRFSRTVILLLPFLLFITNQLKTQDAEKLSDHAKRFLQTRLTAVKPDSEAKTGLIQLNPVYRSADTCRNRLTGFSNSGGGYILVVESGNEIIIAAYSLTGRLDSSDISQGLNAFIRAYESSPVVHTGAKAYSLAKGAVSPLLEKDDIRWNQGDYYNAFCPYDAASAKKTYAGCVAVAVGQILRYHKFPARGSGSHTYTHPVYGELAANFGSTVYDWEAMPGSLNSDNEAVAKLLYHIGISVNMSYGPYGSSAHSSAVPDALSQYFGYRDAQLIHRDNFSYATGEFESVLRSEINNNRPFYYEIPGNPSHAVVVDGYDDEYFHINFGWGGLDNGYFLLSGVNWAGGSMFGFRGNAILGISPQPVTVSVQDSLALVNFFHSTGGQSWHNKTNWLTGRLKTWYGVDLLNGRVLHLLLDNNSLSGSLPADLGKLSALTNLNLSGNNLTGTIPASIGSLTTLYDLTLSFNKLEGTIPAEAGNLSRIQYMQLGFNKLTGPLPDELGQLSNLKYLTLAGNQITGSIPSSLCNLTSLLSLDLSANQFSGNLPAYIGNLGKLNALMLANNKFTGPLPESISLLPDLNVFSIENNSFDGPIPAGIGSFTRLINLNIDNNRFTSIPEEIGNLTGLQRFTAINNKIEGALPSGIGQLVSLKHLDLTTNAITSLPPEIGNLSKLEFLSLAANRLKSLPPETGNMKNLKELYLSGNEIVSLPYEVSGLEKLTILSLENNRLRSLPFGISLAGKLIILNLSYNSLDSPLPPLSHLNLYAFRIDHNNLSFEDIAASGILNPDPADCYYNYQGKIKLSDSVFQFVPGDSVGIDIRNISKLNEKQNQYKWYKGNSPVGDNPVLSFKKSTAAAAGYYYCQVTNPLYPYLTLSTDSILLKVSNEGKLPADTVISKRGKPLVISDTKVKLIKPSGLRGEFRWQSSVDTLNWTDLVLPVTHAIIKENIRNIYPDSLIVEPETRALYRFRLVEGSCDPVYSDTVFIVPYKSVSLLDTVMNVKYKAGQAIIPSIQVTIPKGLSDNDIRLTIDQILTAPAEPDSVQSGPVWELKLSCGSEFNPPILIRLKIDDDSYNEAKKDSYIPVYYNEAERKWNVFEKYGFSTNDTALVIETDHLTKISWWEAGLTGYNFTDKYTRDGVTVYYKEKHADLMGLYDKNQSAQPWHLTEGSPEFGTPEQVQDMAHFAAEVMTRFRSLGLKVPETISIYADAIDDYGVVGLMGMTNGYLTISIYIDDPVLLRSVIAHEYMHYTQDYYILAHPGNIFWMEANGHLADRMVWDQSVIPVSESDNYLLENRTGENSVFKFLSNSWDYWDSSVLTQNLAGNINFCYQAGTFIHYLRSYRIGEKLKPELLLKETPGTGTWKNYLDNHIKTYLTSNLSEQYENYIKYIFSGINPQFSVLNNGPGTSGDPFKFINQAPQEFSAKHLIKLPEDELSIPKEELSLNTSLDPLSVKMEQFFNLSVNRSLCVRYVRQHEDTANMRVYLCKYREADKTLEMTDISRIDSSYFFILAASEENVGQKANQVFLLYINKSSDKALSADYRLEITPVTDFSQLFTFWFGNLEGFEAYIHQYTDGTDRRLYFWEQDGSTRTKVYSDSSFTITEQRQHGSMEVYYNFRNGDLTISENVSGTYEYFDNPEFHTASYSGSRTVSLRNIFFAPQPENQVQMGAGIYDFHSSGTAHTQSLIRSISETFQSHCIDCGSQVVLEDYTYTGTNWNSGSGVKLHIQVK